MNGSVPDRRRLRPLRVAGALVLVPVAVYGAALSYDSLYLAARDVFDTPVFGLDLAVGLPLVVDLLILGASLVYVDGARHGHPGAGWRMTAHAAVATTLLLNALAARTPAEIPWHIVAPAVWSVLVELTAREMLQEWRVSEQAPTGKIPARLWLTAPTESLRTWLGLARRLEGPQASARLDIGLQDAAAIALHTAMAPHGRTGRRTRRTLSKLMRRGVLHPQAILAPLGWGTTDPADRPAATALTPETLLHAALVHVLAPADPPSPPRPAPVRRRERPKAKDHPDAPAPGPALASVHDSASDSKVIDLRRTPPEAETTALTRLQTVAALLRQETDEERVTWAIVKEHLSENGDSVSERTASRVLAAARADLTEQAIHDEDPARDEAGA